MQRTTPNKLQSDKTPPRLAIVAFNPQRQTTGYQVEAGSELMENRLK
jgi:hypothetical protein